MPINFPSSPSANQLFQYNGNSYQWDGSKWRKTNIFSNSIVTEYTNKVEQTTSTVDIQPNKYDYHVLDITGDTTVNVPRAAPNSSFILEINYAPTPAGYNIENASYDNVSFSVNSQDTGPNGLFFKPDGTKMYVVGTANFYVYQYSLSSAWDLSSASYDSVRFRFLSQDSAPRSIFFKPDGTKMYMLGRANDRVYQYSLSSAWDVSTTSYDSVSFSVGSQDSSPFGIFFKSDGTKMYMVGDNNDRIHQYSLSSAWDLSSASYDNVSLSVSAQSSSPDNVLFNDDGTKMYMLGSFTLFQYTLSSAWDLSTASYDSVSFSVGSQDSVAYEIFFKPDGAKMYMVGDNTNTVYQYSSASFVATNITWSSNIQWAGGSAPTIDYTYNSNILLHFYTMDGINWIGSPLSLDSRSS